MKFRRPLVLVAIVIAILLAVLLWRGDAGVGGAIAKLFGGESSVPAANSASAAGKNAQAAASGGAAGASRIIVSDVAAPPPSVAASGGATSTPATSATGGDNRTTVKAWQRALASGNIEANAQDLVTSSDANDWLRLASLHMLCQSSISPSDLEPARASAIEARYGAAYRRVAANFATRCGEFGQNTFVSRFAQLESRAIEDRATVALAPSLNSLTLGKGMSDEELQRLSALFTDGDLATLWLARNFRRLETTLANANGLDGTPPEDLRVASVLALCQRGIDCGAESLMTLQLCAITRGTVCTEAGASAAVQQLAIDRLARINTAARLIDLALSSADPRMLGIRTRPTTP